MSKSPQPFLDNSSRSSGSGAHLSIGDLAEASGVSPATLRVWEQRHGFPVPERLESGHRRYSEEDVDRVRQVLALREAGMRLDTAIERVRSDAGQDAASVSVYAALRRKHPHLQPHRLKKSTLLALSWAIEDEFCAKAEQPLLFGAFQRTKHYEAAEARWEELSRLARATYVYADFGGTTSERRVTKVGLDESDPMSREWSVICDAPGLSAALTAWELPGQDKVPDRHRRFESVWTVNPVAVRDAARTSAEVARRRGATDTAPVLYELADTPRVTPADLEAVSTMFTRVVAYVDRYAAR